MTKQKLLIFGTFLGFLFLIFLVILSVKPKTPSQPNQTSINPTQEIKINNAQEQKVITPQPTIPPQDFTGVKEEELPKEIKDYSEQKLDLMKKLPLKMPYFTIDFDYVEDKFTVTYSDSPTSKQIFFSWLSQNYPALKMEDFEEK
ncbi:MAG: hypothetical protein KatS3mg092_0189 [Patescibacteria group bacterium]|nr:MAG: hypothetical protein KatS3mg092_0189 [Patescibacteria group bacterium]